MPSPSASMLAHLAGSPVYIFEVWKMATRDGLLVAAYANSTRDITFGGVTYKAAPSEPTRTTRKIGLDPDGAELAGVFDDIVTKADVYARRWDDARITKDWVYYYDADGYGSALTQRGFAGKITPGNGTFTVEFRSLSSRLDQPIGKLTSPIDRTRRADETGVSMTPLTHATTVSTITTQRRKFKVPYVQPSANYFRYGIATFTSGANAGQEAEIKSSTTTDSGTRTEIELQQSVRADIAASDGVTLIAGYDGTLDAAKALGAEAVLNFDGEPTMPLPDDLLRYQP